MKKFFLSLSLCAVVGVSSYYFNQEAVAKTKPATKNKSKRKIANVDSVIQMMNEEILKARTKQDINKLFADLEGMKDNPKYKNHKEWQLYYSILSPLRGLEGMAWRLRPILEHSDLLHTYALETISTYHYSAYMYGPHLKAILEWLTTPTERYANAQFKTLSEAQDYIENTVLKYLTIAMENVEKIDFDDNWEMNFDTFLLAGLDRDNDIRYLSERNGNRYKIVTKDHLNFLRSAAYSARGTFKYIINYNVDDAAEFLKTLLTNSAINNVNAKLRLAIFGKTVPYHQTPEKFVKTLKKFDNLLTLRKDIAVAQKNIDGALDDFHKAVELELAAYKGAISNVKLDIANQYIVNPKELMIGQEDEIRDLKDTLTLYKAAKKGKFATLTNPVSGNEMKINLKAFFIAREDLKDFLPNQFADKSNGHEYGKKMTISGKDNWAWNYAYGASTGWPDYTFGTFFDKSTNKKNLFTRLRDLRTHNATVFYANFLPVP